MRKPYLLILILLLFACGPATEPSETGENSSAEAEVVEETPISPTEVPEEATETPARATATVTQPAEEGGSSSQTDGSSIGSSDSSFPARTTAEASIVRASDHVLGSVDPLITIIEYGDFQ